MQFQVVKSGQKLRVKARKPAKCMPSLCSNVKRRSSFAQLRKRRREEAKHRGQKPVNTPTFSEEAKDIIKDR